MTEVLRFARDITQRGLGIPLGIMALLAMMVVPLPPILLDMLFTFNIALSIVVIIAGIYTKKPLEFAAFPTVLLLATLLRLALNVASTRLVLLNGHNGPDAAGRVIESFGEFVIGGNYTVGVVVFIILVIINFIVVTKGAGRISEVSARFTLDSMPGKQMAIDADLNAGLITQDEAKVRREEVVREADFYGSMDGASKFVRGDAIAGILILLINVVGGIAIGAFQHGMPFSESVSTYTLLTIGDGLVAQIPALILSTSAAIMVTRVSSSHDIGEQIVMQLFKDHRTLALTGGIIGIMGLIPGMPNVPFLLLAGACGVGTYWIYRQRPGTTSRSQKKTSESTKPAEAARQEPKDLSWDDVLPVDPIGLEVGYKLIPLVDKNQGGQLMTRIKGVRKKLTQDLGFLIPSVHIRDNLELTPNSYRITILGVTAGQSDIFADKELAINPGKVFGQLQGIPGKEPAFGLDAVWIDPNQREQAQTLGYTVVDSSTVVATHLSDIVQKHAAKLLGREEVQHLLNGLGKIAPKLVEELPSVVSPQLLTRVLQNLLEENIPIKDMRTIAETLASQSGKSQDPVQLTAAVRVALGRLIIQKINGVRRELSVVVLDPDLERILHDVVQTAGDSGVGIEPGLAERLHKSLSSITQKQEALGEPAVLLVTAPLRPMMARFARHTISGLCVLSYHEVPDDKQIKVIASVGK